MGQALDNLYRVFARYPRPKTFRACGCCFDGREISSSGWNGTSRPEVEALSPGQDRPLRELVADDLDGLIGDVPLTSGDTPLLKHYLPRAFELSLNDEMLMGPFAIWGSINWSDPPRVVPWTEWPAEEQEAITEFMLEAWADHCTADAFHASDVLDGVLYTTHDMAPFLELWRAADPDPLHRQEVFDSNEKPSAERVPTARRNWELAKAWLEANW